MAQEEGDREMGPAPTEDRLIKDWRFVCAKPEGAKAEMCQISQLLLVGEGEERRLALNLVIQHVPDSERFAAMVTLPLGMTLIPGIQLKVDDNEPIRAAVNMCMPIGCQALVALSEETIKSMKSGEKLFVAYYPFQSKQNAVVPVSLNGFTEAYNALYKKVIK